MRPRGILALTMIALGVVLLGFSIGSMVVHFSLFSGVTFAAVAGGLLLVVGLLLLITELLESWLSKGQAALVDGLQAG